MLSPPTRLLSMSTSEKHGNHGLNSKSLSLTPCLLMKIVIKKLLLLVSTPGYLMVLINIGKKPCSTVLERLDAIQMPQHGQMHKKKLLKSNLKHQLQTLKLLTIPFGIKLRLISKMGSKPTRLELMLLKLTSRKL